MGVEENKVMVNVGVPFSMLRWIDTTRKVSRSVYLGKIVIPEIAKRMQEEQESRPACNQL